MFVVWSGRNVVETGVELVGVKLEIRDFREGVAGREGCHVNLEAIFDQKM